MGLEYPAGHLGDHEHALLGIIHSGGHYARAGPNSFREEKEMKARTATVGDLEAVFRNLSNRLSEEYVSAGLGTRAVQDGLTMDLKEGRAHSLVEGDEAVAIIAWHESDGVAHTVFAAKDDFFSAATVRFCKRHVRRIQALTGNLPFRHESWLAHPDAVKWFRIIGFVERSRQPGNTLFELPPA